MNCSAPRFRLTSTLNHQNGIISHKLVQEVFSLFEKITFKFLIIACLFVTIIPSAMAATATGGTITVNSYPAGAAVYLNGMRNGETPAEFDNLTPGNYSVMIRLAGYNDSTIPVVLSDGSLREIRAELVQSSSVAPVTSIPVLASTYGSIAIDSNPGGASVTLDGKTVGRTPATRAALILNTIATGDHTIGVELAGFPQYTQTISVIENQVVQVNADFITRSPTIPGTPITTTDRREPIPLSPGMAIAACGLIALAMVLRSS
jgi:hypothetical protein